MTDDQQDRNLADLRGARRRTVDEHMFSVDDTFGPPATFRLQVFTAPGLRPVAIATQTLTQGRSLTNSAEDFAAAVWQKLLPGETAPPIWIQRQLLDYSDDADAGGGGVTTWELVEFGAASPYELADPGWTELTGQQLAQIVGGPVDGGRGAGYVARPPGPRYRTRYVVAWTVTYPRPKPFRARECMAHGVTLGRRLLRQMWPRRGPLGTCCWYHGGDWHVANKLAIELSGAALRAGVDPDDVSAHVRDELRTRDLDPWTKAAVKSLVSPDVGIDPGRVRWKPRFVNGQHRAQAMLEAGVRRALVVTPERVDDAAAGQPTR